MVGYIVVDFPAFTGEKEGSFTCTVLPNPGNGNITLNLNSSQAEQLELSVFDMIGTLVYSEKDVPLVGQLSKGLNLTGLPEGVYFLKIAGKQMMITRKLIIKR